MWNIDIKKLALALACTSSSTLMAQVGDARNDFAIGVTGGVNMSSVSFNPSVKQGSLMGKNAGITLRYTCEKYITAVCAIQLECNYATQGWKEIADETTATFSKTMNYLQFPLLARLAWGRERKGAQGYIVLGPQMGILLSESQTMDSDWKPEDRTHTYQYSHDADNKLDYGITAGAGMEVSSPNLGHFQLEARYYYGLRDFYDNSSKGYFGRSGHSAITLKVGYLFDILKTKNPNIR